MKSNAQPHQSDNAPSSLINKTRERKTKDDSPLTKCAQILGQWLSQL